MDTSKSPEHCGGCFQAVGAAEVCDAGQPVCQGTWCQDPGTGESVCADVWESSEHCGACGAPLTEHEVCRKGLRQAKMVLLPPGFYIDSTEVTRAQYAAWLDTDRPLDGFDDDCAASNIQFTPQCGWPPGDRGNYPVRCTDWCDAQAYCASLGKHLCGRVGGGPILLSTDRDKADVDQWFDACSSGGAHSFGCGDEYVAGVCSDGPLAEVGSTPGCQSPESEYAGVFDLCGSAWEWTMSCGLAHTNDPGRCRRRRVPGTAANERDCAGTDEQPRTYTAPTAGFRCCAP